MNLRKDMMKKRGAQVIFSLVCLFVFVLVLPSVWASVYYSDVYFSIPDSVYITGERIELKGWVYQTNYSSNGTLVLNYSTLAGAVVNLTMTTVAGEYVSNYTFTTNDNGAFFSRSKYHKNASYVEVNASSTSGKCYLTARYIDSNGNSSFSRVEITVINKTLDTLTVSSNKAAYYPSESIKVNARAIRKIGDKILYVNNVSINGTLRDSANAIVNTFNCTTGNNGKCSVTLSGLTSYGDYILELDNFKTFSSFSIVPFSYLIYMKDDTGKSIKNVFAMGEQGRVEVKINNASDDDIYTFSGYISDSSGNSIKQIGTTTLNSNNSFTNSFLFTVDTNFMYGAYSAHITVSEQGGGSISSLASFQVEDWTFSVDKREVDSGFEYEYSSFSNKTLSFNSIPTYRSNGSIIGELNSSSFNITLKDNLNNILSSTGATWNSSCGQSGCYDFSLPSPNDTGEYAIYSTLAFNGDTQINTKIIYIIGGVLSAQSVDKDGNVKELFGTNEYVYISLFSYNVTSAGFNLSDAEVFLVSYMNGSDFTYSNLSDFELVNLSNSAYEWAWNSSLQRIKLDVPRIGGLYKVYLFANNKTLGAEAKFIVNPYDVCTVPKDTPGAVTSGYYYVWQFKTTDTIYFEVKLAQANNPGGRASALNTSGNGSTMGYACKFSSTKQLVNNATLSVLEVTNLESGALQSLNVSESTCQAADSNGTYSCTVKPKTKWNGGANIVKFNILGQDGTSSIAYSRFEARAFYLYGWASVYQNNPTSNISLYVQMYEAGRGWWGSSGSLSGTVSVKKIEYQGRDGEWLSTPVDSGYNVSRLNSSTFTSNSYNNQISLPVSYNPSESWKTGYYRVLLQATTSSGDSDYGYAWFGVKLWDVYGQPVECLSSLTTCTYKSYFNSKENITLYIRIAKAGDSWWYGYDGYRDIYGNVTIGIKKIQECRTWPCKELNTSEYSVNTINVNESSPSYYTASANQSRYIIQINKTSGGWNTGYYQVILNINGTDTGYGWFNTIAFYVEASPTNSSGTGYKYTIRGSQSMYFNVSTTKSYKWWNSYSGIRYDSSDYVNTTLSDATLRSWNYQTNTNAEYNYPEDINITPTGVNGTAILEIAYLGGSSWPSGYYYGELTMRNPDNETSTGWLWFNVQPFRVDSYTGGNVYNLDNEQCVNVSLYVRDSDWYTNNLMYGNYSVTQIYEDIWSGYSSSRTSYSNYTINSAANTTTFNATANLSVCPNSGSWTGGNWGGYHYMNIIVKDNSDNSTQNGWLYFKALPFSASWTSPGTKRTNADVDVNVSLTKPSSSVTAVGNLTEIYQWRYDNYQSTRESYNFSVGNASTGICYSNVSRQCRVNGTQEIKVYAPSGGWYIGNNYLHALWTSSTDSTVKVDDWSGFYFDARTVYNGWFDNWWYDNSGNYRYQYYFVLNENILIKINVRNDSYDNVNASVSKVEYAYSGNNCWSDYCRSYSDATSTTTITNLTSGGILLNITAPSTNWTVGDYAIRATIFGSGGTVRVTGGIVRARDATAPNLTISVPVNNATYNYSLALSATTNENARCYVFISNYNNFYNWYCTDWNATNLTNLSIALKDGACNQTRWGYNGTTYYNEYMYSGWHAIYNGSDWTYPGTYLATGGTSHTYTFNTTDWPNNQDYGMQVWCNDEDWNHASILRAFKINNTG